MSNTKPSGDDVVVPTKNRIADAKKFAWSYVVTALLYQLVGGPPLLAFLFLMTTFFAGLLILQNSDEHEQIAISWVMVVFMLLNAAVLVVNEHSHSMPPENLFIALWIIQKLWYVFGMAIFLPVLLDPMVKKSEYARCWAIGIAFTLQLGLAVFMFFDKREERITPVHCEKIVEMTCVPVDKPVPWYDGATLAEDLVFGLLVVLVTAAYKKDDEPASEGSKQD